MFFFFDSHFPHGTFPIYWTYVFQVLLVVFKTNVLTILSLKALWNVNQLCTVNMSFASLVVPMPYYNGRLYSPLWIQFHNFICCNSMKVISYSIISPFAASVETSHEFFFPQDNKKLVVSTGNLWNKIKSINKFP